MDLETVCNTATTIVKNFPESLPLSDEDVGKDNEIERAQTDLQILSKRVLAELEKYLTTLDSSEVEHGFNFLAAAV